MTAALIFDVAAALLKGASLTASSATVGPYQFDVDDILRFACVDAAGKLVSAREEWDETRIHVATDRKGWSSEAMAVSRHDWSAFGAARAFVAVVGEVETARILSRLLEAA